MALIVLVFVVILALTFVVLIFLTHPSAEDRAVQARVAGIQAGASAHAYLGEDLPEFLKYTKLSKINWLDKLLQRWNLAHEIQLLLAQAESSWSVSMVFGGAAGSAALGFAIAYYWLSETAVAVVIALLFAALPFFLLHAKRARRMRRFDRTLPEAIDLITRALRAGHSMGAAIEIVGTEAPEPVRSEFREVYRQQNFGLPQREALLQLSRRMPTADLRFVITAMLVQKETGGNLVDILDRTVAVIRERLRIEGEVRIYTAQGRLTGVILALLPLVMFFLINLANHNYTRVLLEDPLGKQLIYAGLTAMVLGGLVIRKIVNVKV